MGQYYKAVLLKEDKKTPFLFADNWDFGSGAKLMEHSWMKNNYVGFIEKILINSPTPIVWAGDYADEDEDGENLYSKLNECLKITHNQDISDGDKYNHDYKTVLNNRYKYIINLDKGIYVDKSKTPLDNDGWQIHPLPLLTCEGNGRGGGDFRGVDENNLIGSWARNTIKVCSRKSEIPKGFTEIQFNLTE